jgi:hypothetical protein
LSADTKHELVVDFVDPKYMDAHSQHINDQICCKSDSVSSKNHALLICWESVYHQISAILAQPRNLFLLCPTFSTLALE